MFTRKDYLDKKCTHIDYYGQFVTQSHINTVKDLVADGDNKTPLAVWDNLPITKLAIPMDEVGDYLTLSGKVCILKEACRQYHNNK